MNIGIDIDDTIVNTYEMLLTLISMKYGINFDDLINRKLSYLDVFRDLENFDIVKKDLFPIVAKSVKLKENVLNILTKLREDGHKIIFITARNNDEYGNSYKITYEYLLRNNIPFDKLIVSASEKGKVCVEEKIDLFVDDNMKNCEDVRDVGIKTYQFDTMFTKNVDGVKRIFSWNEFYDLVRV